MRARFLRACSVASWSLVASGVLFAGALSGCSDATTTRAPAPVVASGVETPAQTSQTATRNSALVDADGHNWLIVGAKGAELIGPDGAPNVPSARLVNEGVGISVGVNLSSGWVIVGPQGKLSYLDDEGKPKRADIRTILDGSQARFAVLGRISGANNTTSEGGMVGGADGLVQFVDEFGEPVATPKKIFVDGDAATGAAYHPGTKSWLIGDENGQLLAVNDTLVTISAAAPFSVAVAGIAGNADANAAQEFVAVAGDEFSFYPNPNATSLGTGSTATVMAQKHDGNATTVAIGTADGRVAVSALASVSGSMTWQTVFSGAAVKHIEPGTDGWLVTSADGQIRKLDTSGAPVGEAAQIGDGSPITSARAVASGWLLGAERSLVLQVDSTLQSITEVRDVLDGKQVMGATSTAKGVLVVGEGGAYRMINADGTPNGPVKTLPGGADLKAVSWSGEVFLAVGAGGFGHLIDADGNPQGDAITMLDGTDVEFAAWNGTFWLVGGAGGKTQRVRANGTLVGNVIPLDGFDHVYDARWSGVEWMAVGGKAGQGVVMLVNSDGTPKTTATTVPGTTGPFYAVDYNGREWLAGGADGLVQIFSAQGVPRTGPAPLPRDMLNGEPIHDIDFNGEYYIVAGARGLVRIFQNNLLGPSLPVSTMNFGAVHAIAWTNPRGYSGGLCLSREHCYQGTCVGDSLQTGFCCDRACDNPCESCFKVDTGVDDGTCAPVTKGREAVGGGCAVTDAATCGTTGTCDGAGGCEVHAATVECGAATCMSGELVGASMCDGMGMCAASTATTSCAPYKGCDGDACATSCATNDECVDGFECVDMACKEPQTPEPPAKKDEDEGCSTAPAGAPAPASLLLLAGGVVALLRRRRRD